MEELTEHNPFGVTSTAILHNAATGRFHPILFRAAPSHSHPDRQRSKGHHTDGFASKEEAIFYCTGLGLPEPFALLEWDGSGIPAMSF